MADLFAPDSVIRRVSAEPALLVGAGRALVLQLAHPAVAQGVRDHSDFQRRPFRRLQGTLEAVYSVVFGGEALAEGIGRRIRSVHDHITGATYRANDPEHLLWVHATLADTALTLYQRLVQPLTADDRAAYYEDMTRVAEIFGCPRAEQPADVAAFDAYMVDQMARTRVGEVGRELIADVLGPRLPLRLEVPLSPLVGLQRTYALGLLSPAVREQLDVAWDADDERRLAIDDRRLRAVMRAPRAVRTAPVAAGVWVLRRQARRHVAAFEERRRPAPISPGRGPGPASG